MRIIFLSFVLSFCILFINPLLKIGIVAQEAIPLKSTLVYTTYTSDQWASNTNETSNLLARQFIDLSNDSKIEIGCGSEKLIFTNGDAIQAFLTNNSYSIAGNAPSHLSKYMDRSSEVGKLAREILTLKLNIALNDDVMAVHPKFKYLMFLSPDSPSFYGSRVNSVLNHCNNALGECSNAKINMTELIDALKEINAGFIDHESNGVLFPARDN